MGRPACIPSKKSSKAKRATETNGLSWEVVRRQLSEGLSPRQVGCSGDAVSTERID